VSGDDAVKPLLPRLKHLTVAHAVPPGSRALLIRDAVLHCSALFPTCDFVLMPRSGLGSESLHR